MEINTLADIITERRWDKKEGIKRIVRRIQERMEAHLPKGVAFSLTGLQKQALNHPAFWDNRRDNEGEPRHLIVQGATSAGKTLLSEMNVIDALQNEQTAIVLVPLKAMVRERTEQFAEDMKATDYRVYGSSSDYQENDEKIINGEFNVAVIVYEKFFAMLSQSNCKILEGCRLIVVDELSMLTKEERGAKLEIALEMARRINPATRIMCLATIDCKTNKIAQWLQIDGIDADVIESPLRPVGLDESIVLLDGACWTRHIPGENEMDGETMEQSTETFHQEDEPTIRFEIPGYSNDQHELEKRLQLLKVIIKKIFASCENAKVLVFVPSRDDTIGVAKFLKSNVTEIFSAHELDEEFRKKINACDKDEDQSILLTELLPYGIAYHNAGVSTNLRELIEEEFPKDSTNLKVIVATETLTIGVNMPFDCMIIFNHEVPRGVGKKQPLTNQEYRNFIGRAGRLGQSNRIGSTYLFVPTKRDRDRYWGAYYDTDHEIISANTNASTKEQVPYYLSLLAHQTANTSKIGTEFEKQLVNTLSDLSFSNICGGKPVDAEELLQKLYDTMLTEENTIKTLRKKEKITKHYLTSYGINLAPYALTINTCDSIYRYFVSCQDYEESGMPAGLTQKDIESDRYLLDFLYRILMHEELKCSSVLTYFPGKRKEGGNATTAKRMILNALNRILEEKEEETGQPKYELWNGSELKLLRQDKFGGDEAIKLQAVLRTILLFYWTQGKLMPEIKEITGLDHFTKKIITGDFERIAEIVSFHLEAIISSLNGVTMDDGYGRQTDIFADSGAFHALYALSTRIKYGMPRDMVVLANKHIHGLDRSRIIACKKAIDASGMTTLQCIYRKDLSNFMTNEQQRLLRQHLELRNTTENFDTWLDILRNDQGSEFTDEVETGLRYSFEWNGENCNSLYQAFKKTLKDKYFYDFANIEKYSDSCFTWIYRDKNNNFKTFYVGIVKKNITKSEAEQMKMFLNRKQEEVAACILITHPSERMNGALSLFQFDLAMTSEFFARILADAIRLEQNGADALAAFLEDTRGFFDKEDIYQVSLANYVAMEPSEKEPCFRIVYSKRSRRMSSLNGQNIAAKLGKIGPFEEMAWGTDLVSLLKDKRPVIVLLERNQVERSRWLTDLMYQLRQNNMDNSLLIFCAEDAQKSWNNPISYPKQSTQKWYRQCSEMKQELVFDVEEAVCKIEMFVNDWYHPHYMIGVSYAHYDSQDENNLCSEENQEYWEGDIRKLRRVVDALKSIYGEQKIFFDQYYPAYYTFYGNNGHEESWNKYRECSLFLILYNYWSKENENCKQERDVIYETCQRKQAQCVYLQSSYHHNPPLPDGHTAFPLSLDEDLDIIVHTLRTKLEEALKESQNSEKYEKADKNF